MLSLYLDLLFQKYVRVFEVHNRETFYISWSVLSVVNLFHFCHRGLVLILVPGLFDVTFEKLGPNSACVSDHRSLMRYSELYSKKLLFWQYLWG